MITNKCGIYRITNTVTGDYYIGSSSNIRKRIEQHRRGLVSNKHCNRHLQNAWNKYDEQVFIFTALLLCDAAHRLYYEQGFLDLFKPAYNIAACVVAPTQGLQRSEETKHKISEANTGKHFSEEHKRKLSEAHKGERSFLFGKHLSEETKRKIGEANKGEKSYLFGTHLSEEAKQKLSEANKGERGYWFGKSLSEETKQKISEAATGRVCSEELRKIRSENAKGERNPNFGKHSPSEEGRAKMSEANIGKHPSEETRRKMSESRYRYIETHKENSTRSNTQKVA